MAQALRFEVTAQSRLSSHTAALAWMGAPGAPRARASVVVVRPCGDVVYVNDPALAEHFLGQLACASPGQDLEARSLVVASSLAVHRDLNEVSGVTSHNLGLAAAAAAPRLSLAEARAVRSLRRKANAAKHQWPRGPAGPAPSAASPPSSSCSSARSTTPRAMPSSGEDVGAAVSGDPDRVLPADRERVRANDATIGDATNAFYIGEESHEVGVQTQLDHADSPEVIGELLESASPALALGCTASSQTTCTLENTLVLSQAQLDERVRVFLSVEQACTAEASDGRHATLFAAMVKDGHTYAEVRDMLAHHIRLKLNDTVGQTDVSPDELWARARGVADKVAERAVGAHEDMPPDAGGVCEPVASPDLPDLAGAGSVASEKCTLGKNSKRAKKTGKLR
uniref:Uncharacterized protein n=1 Tax=Zooxanthella nutricula TaxID=1333877 RepID=A0A7S2MXF7_9DINO